MTLILAVAAPSIVAIVFSVIGFAIAISLIIFKKMDEEKTKYTHFRSAKQLNEQVRLRAIEIVERQTRAPAYLCDARAWLFAIQDAEIEIWDDIMPEEDRPGFVTAHPTKEESMDPWDYARPRSLMICYAGTPIENAKRILASGSFPRGSTFFKHLIGALDLGGLAIFEIVCPRSWWEERTEMPPHVWVDGGETKLEQPPAVYKPHHDPHGDGDKWRHVINEPLPTNCVVRIREYTIITILEREHIALKVIDNNHA